MAALAGIVLEKIGEGERITVKWKCNSFLGIGGDRSQDYIVCNYKFPKGGHVPVYINASWHKPQKFTLDPKVRYGMNDGILFFVLDDLSNKPFQHRFKRSDVQKTLYKGNEWLKNVSGHVDLSWVAGDHLREIL